MYIYICRAQKTRYVRAFAPMLGKSLLVRTEGVWKQVCGGRRNDRCTRAHIHTYTHIHAH